MAGRLEGRIAVVTGGARGLGAATAEGLAGEGAKVAVADVDEDGARRTAERLATKGASAIAVVADCATSEGIRQLFDTVEGEWDAPADALVNNAGVLSSSLLLDVGDEEVEAVLRVNTAGPILATREFARRLVARGRPGAVVNITSTSAHIASLPGLSVYAASKGGLLAFTRAAATDLARHGIRVNAVAPGWMRTEMSGALDEQRVRRRIPMRRGADPRELVGGIVYLLSEDAGYVTGTSLAIDGGWLAY